MRPLPVRTDSAARAVAVAVALALCAAPAAAGIVDDNPPGRSFTPSTIRAAGDGALSYRTSNRERNVVTIRRSGEGGLVLRDSVPVIAVQGPCANVTFTEVRCPAAAHVRRVRVRMGARDRLRCSASAVMCDERRSAPA